MTPPTTTQDTRPPSAPAAKRPSLSPVQMAASALAAASAAVVASFFGVAGTVIGAAVASVITTVSAAVYSESLRRSSERLRLARERLARRSPGTAGPPAAPRAARDDATAVLAGLPGRLDPRRAPAPR